MTKRRYENIFIVLLLVVSFVMTPFARVNVYADSIPKYTAKATDENVLAVLKKYDPAGYFFVKYVQDNCFDAPTMWYSEDDGILDEITTTVHEACHGYSGDLQKTSYDDGAWLETYGFRVAPDTDMYEHFDSEYLVFTNEIAHDIPGELRDRWETYIGDDAGYGVANQYGVYGMLDEFNAYAWSLEDVLCMYKYVKDSSGKKAAVEWLKLHGPTYVSAYYEYKLWFHVYLKHVKDNYPDLYAAIAGNEEFVNIYRVIESNYAGYISRYKELTGTDGAKDYRKAVMKVIKGKEYKEIRELLKGKKIDTSKYVWTGSMDWTTIRSVTFEDGGIKIAWRVTKDADGFELYRKTGDEEYSMIKDVVKDVDETSQNYAYIDKDLKGGKTYTYYVLPYKINSDGTKTYGEKSIERQKKLLPKVITKNVEYKNGMINVSWKKYKGKGVSGFELSYKVDKGGNSYTKADGTQIDTSSSSSYSEYCYDTKATTYSISPTMGYVEYVFSMRAFFEKDGETIYSPWSDKITVRVKK